MPSEKAEVEGTGKATIVVKVTRVNGTEETYYSDNVSVAKAKTIESLMKEQNIGSLGLDEETLAAAAHQKNEEESKRNEAANRAAVRGGK